MSTSAHDRTAPRVLLPVHHRFGPDRFPPPPPTPLELDASSSSTDSSGDKGLYFEDDIFAGQMVVDKYDRYKAPWMSNAADPAEQFSCNDWDDDGVYPTGTCMSGDDKQCATLGDFHAFNTLCNSSCATSGATWGVPCAWEVISKLGIACETVKKTKSDESSNHSTFTASFPNASKNLWRSYEKEYNDNLRLGKTFTPFEFNSTMDTVRGRDSLRPGVA